MLLLFLADVSAHGHLPHLLVKPNWLLLGHVQSRNHWGLNHLSFAIEGFVFFVVLALNHFDVTGQFAESTRWGWLRVWNIPVRCLTWPINFL
jgi:hypothetical protein